MQSLNGAGAFLVVVASHPFGLSTSFGAARLLLAGASLAFLVWLIRVGVAAWEARGGDALVRARYRDPVTGMHNRAALMVLGSRMAARSHAGEAPLNFLLISVDGLRDLEGRYGAKARDLAICAVSGALRTLTSEEVCMARMRQAEFGVFLLGQPMQQAAAVAERLQAAVKELGFYLHGRELALTVSVCVVQMRAEDKGWVPMLCRADVGLLCAREAGPNQLVREAVGVDADSGRRSALGRTQPAAVRAALL